MISPLPSELSPKKSPANTLSYTNGKLLKECTRKYQLLHLKQYYEETNVHFSFGRAVGAGFAEAVVQGDLEKGLLATALNYVPYASTEKKNLHSALVAVATLFQHWEDNDLSSLYEVIATERAFRLSFLPKRDRMSFISERERLLFYDGHIDLLLKHRYSGALAVLDVKTTQWNQKNLYPIYFNASQVTVYGAVTQYLQYCDQHPEGSRYSPPSNEIKPVPFERLYFTAQLTSNACRPHWNVYPTDAKVVLSALDYVQDTLLRLEHLPAEAEPWSMNGEACLSYGRPCPLLYDCDSDQARNAPLNLKPLLPSVPDSEIIRLKDVIDFWKRS